MLPDIVAPSIDGLKLERLIVPVTRQAGRRSGGRTSPADQKSYTDAPKTKKAANGDQLIIDFVGKLDGVEFDGGKAEGTPLVLGSGQFIPGFEEQLVGAKAGDAKTITVTFPADYPSADLKGKDATFDIAVKAVKVEGETKADEDFAKSLGLESLDKLKELLRGQLEQETAGLTRTAMKRALLDTLAADHDFAVPPTMVEAEFEQIWAQLQQEAAREADPAAALKEIEAEKDDYRRIAERRVRLGLLLSEIGQANGVEVSRQEMDMLIRQAAQQYRPEDRQRFVDYVAGDAMAQAQLRAPLYEDKVVDFLFDKADVTEREVTREELEAAIEAEEAPAEAKPRRRRPRRRRKRLPKKAAKASARQEEGRGPKREAARQEGRGQRTRQEAWLAPRRSRAGQEARGQEGPRQEVRLRARPDDEKGRGVTPRPFPFGYASGLRRGACLSASVSRASIRPATGADLGRGRDVGPLP